VRQQEENADKAGVKFVIDLFGDEADARAFRRFEAPAATPAEPAPTASDDTAPRKAGWWSRRFGSGESAPTKMAPVKGPFP
jgi:hypothetical protein